jgi:hypothetical protein
MKKIILNLLCLYVSAEIICIKAQDITFMAQDTLLVDTFGSEMIFNISVTNISAQEQTIFIKRTINNLPSDWQSSLCFSLCFAPFVDSIVTSKDFGSSPLSPGENRIVSVHVFPQNNSGTGLIEVEAGTLNNPTILYSARLSAVVNFTSINDLELIPDDFSLSQNYPNPFNPTTKIKYSLSCVGAQCIVPLQLKVFDMLGREVTTLVKGEKPAGNYEAEFNSHNLPSGIYFYRLTSSNFTLTRKMILEK